MGIIATIITVIFLIVVLLIQFKSLTIDWRDGILNNIDWRDGIINNIFLIILSYAVYILVVTWACFVAFCLGANTVHEEHIVCPIVSINSNSDLSGSFFLGSGILEGERRYVYYKKIRAEVVQEDSTPIQNSIICEDIGEGEEPRIEYYVRIATPNAWSRFFSVIKPTRVVECYEFHVPKGTVIQEFRVQ